MIYTASLSYGKDSMAMLHVIRDVLDWPLDRVVTVDVWATQTIRAEFPEVTEFKQYADEEIKKRWGIVVEHFCAEKSYEENFYTKVGDKRFAARSEEYKTKKKCFNESGDMTIVGFPLMLGPWCNNKQKTDVFTKAKKTYEDFFYYTRKHGTRAGEINGFPMLVPACQGELKRPVFDRIKRETSGYVQYIGIAADEGKRTERHKAKAEAGKEKLPLVEAGWTEQMCMDWCRENKLLSPTYTTATRDGCWFCHNQGVAQLRKLRREHPDLWQLLLKWDSDSPTTFHPDGRTVHDFDQRFQWEDEGYQSRGSRFRWDDLENPQMNIFQFLGGDNDDSEGTDGLPEGGRSTGQ